MSATRQQCKGCSAMILDVTAVAHTGYCGTCARTRGWSYRLRQLGLFFSAAAAVLFAVLCGPFIAGYLAIRGWFRRRRFPFDGAALLSAIAAVHPPGIATVYLDGVIDGYWQSTQEMVGWARNQPRFYGQIDGGRLRRGELAISDIPTHRERLIIEGRPMGVCTREASQLEHS